MMTMVALLVFGGALAASIYAIVATVGPRFGQIADALYGRRQPRFQPLATLVRAERHIAVRRWAAAPVARSAYRVREAA